MVQVDTFWLNGSLLFEWIVVSWEDRCGSRLLLLVEWISVVAFDVVGCEDLCVSIGSLWLSGSLCFKWIVVG